MIITFVSYTPASIVKHIEKHVPLACDLQLLSGSGSCRECTHTRPVTRPAFQQYSEVFLESQNSSAWFESWRCKSAYLGSWNSVVIAFSFWTPPFLTRMKSIKPNLAASRFQAFPLLKIQPLSLSGATKTSGCMVVANRTAKVPDCTIEKFS